MLHPRRLPPWGWRGSLSCLPASGARAPAARRCRAQTEIRAAQPASAMRVQSTISTTSFASPTVGGDSAPGPAAGGGDSAPACRARAAAPGRKEGGDALVAERVERKTNNLQRGKLSQGRCEGTQARVADGGVEQFEDPEPRQGAAAQRRRRAPRSQRCRQA